MTSERSQAYGRVMKTVADLAGGKLHGDEEQVVREAADALFFCETLDADTGAQDALGALYGLADRLVESDRLMPETAAKLIADVEACGPLAPVG